MIQLNQEKLTAILNEDTSGALTIIDFWADWCGPCKAFAAPYATLAGHYGSDTVVFAKCDVMQLDPATVADMGIKGIPAIRGYRNGEVVFDFAGANASAVEELIRKEI